MPRWRSHRGVAPLAHRRNENAPVWRNARTKSGRGKPSAILSAHNNGVQTAHRRSEEHTSELQSLMRISYAVFCLKKKISTNQNIIGESYDMTSVGVLHLSPL